MKNTQKGFVVPLVIAIVAVLAVGGWVYHSKNNAGTNSGQNTSQVSDWENYSNDIVGLSFKYPSSWYVHDGITVENKSGTIDVANYPIPITEPAPRDSVGIQFQYHTKLVSETLQNIASRPSEMGGFIPKTENILIAGRQSIKSNEIGSAMYLIPKSDTEYFIVIAGALENGTETLNSILPKVLSSIEIK